MPPQRICGNPLFRDWIDAERRQAQEKGLKSAETFGKAYKSLAACPVTYSHPRELVCLQGIGPKIVELLTRKWRIHCDENNIPLEATPHKRRPRAASASPHGSADEAGPSKPTKKRAPVKAKAYIPQPRSGGYALLLGLVLAIPDPARNTMVYLTKNELIQAAQPHCDASFTHSEKGAYYTAWSSMKTLINKGYIYMTGNPNRYCLMEEGYDVACALRDLLPEFAHIEKYPFLHEPIAGSSHMAGPSRTAPSRRPVSPEFDDVMPMSRIPSNHSAGAKPSKRPAEEVSAQKSSGRFRFWYIDTMGRRVESINSAMIRLDPDEYVNLRRIEFRVDQRSHPFVKQLKLVESAPRNRDAPGGGSLFGFIAEEGAPPLCSKFDDCESIGATKRPRLSMDSDTSYDELFDVINSRDQSAFAQTHSIPSTVPSRAAESASLLAARAAEARLGAGRRTTTTTQSLSDIPPQPKAQRAAPRLSSHIPIHNPLLHSDSYHSATSTAETGATSEASNLPSFTPRDALTFPAGSYEIVLILDTREIESKSSRDKIAEALLTKGVKVETRALRLGDMCWIARKLDGVGGEEDECVLDYVVERKRLDDLCHSIRDGRYTEQCFRLGNSGINHVYYIVEDFQLAERMEYNGLQIMTAKSQIQVHNRFFLKETHKLSETIDFLATMTGVITSLHVGTDLHIIPTRYLSRSTYKALQAHLRATYPHKTFLTSFESYQDLNDKTASQTLREKFARMLLAVKGMSAERVSAVLDVWETPRALWEDLKVHEAQAQAASEELEYGLYAQEEAAGKKKKKSKERGREMFFADKVKGEGRRKIGDALSKEIYRTLMTATPVEDY